jgi:hypothetical protein
MKKIILTAVLATTMVAGTVNAQDNLMMSGAQNVEGFQQHDFNRAATFGVSYTYRFGASKAEEYGTLNIRNLTGRNIPVVNFSSQGSTPSQLMLNAMGDGESMSSNKWLYVLGGMVVIAGGVLLLGGGEKKPWPCDANHPYFHSDDGGVTFVCHVHD